jgi:hypothetical protein
MNEKKLEIGKFYEVTYKTIFGTFKTIYGDLSSIIIIGSKENYINLDGKWIKEKKVRSIKEIDKSEFIKLRAEVE